MKITDGKTRSYGRLVWGVVLTLLLALESPLSAFAFHKDRDNNPPGARGGQGTNWENPAGQHHRHPQKRYKFASKRLEKLQTRREKLVQKGASEEVLAKIDQRISKLQEKINGFNTQLPQPCQS